jgi:hypothetical protein
MQLDSPAVSSVVKGMDTSVDPSDCHLKGRPLGDLFDNADVLDNFKDTLVVTADGHKFRQDIIPIFKLFRYGTGTVSLPVCFYRYCIS